MLTDSSWVDRLVEMKEPWGSLELLALCISTRTSQFRARWCLPYSTPADVATHSPHHLTMTAVSRVRASLLVFSCLNLLPSQLKCYGPPRPPPLDHRGLHHPVPWARSWGGWLYHQNSSHHNIYLPTVCSPNLLAFPCSTSFFPPVCKIFGIPASELHALFYGTNVLSLFFPISDNWSRSKPQKKWITDFNCGWPPSYLPSPASPPPVPRSISAKFALLKCFSPIQRYGFTYPSCKVSYILLSSLWLKGFLGPKGSHSAIKLASLPSHQLATLSQK